MYEAHFGLKSTPFGSKAEGAGVFTGPAQVAIMTNLKKGLTAQDAVVTVNGAVGVGKTTIVSRALESISPNRMVAWVGRMQLAPDEVLELLLAGFGLNKKAKSTIQRFALFRRLLAERAAAGAPVAIVVEDAQRIGVDALVELEALTAADAGDGTGANIILMGQPGLNKMLASPEVARLNQRNRLRQTIEALTQAEVNGYLKHCIRDAGGEYEKIFAPGVAEIVFACSNGIPRMINTLCATAMTTAMEEDLDLVSAELMHKVATDAFGFDGPIPESVVPAVAEASEPEPAAEAPAASKAKATDEEVEIDWEAPPAPKVAETSATASATDGSTSEDDLPQAARNIVVESGHFPALPDMPADSPLASPGESAQPETNQPEPQPVPSANKSADASNSPELFNDTQPELSTLNVPNTDEAVTDVLDVDVESTAIQEQLAEDVLRAATAGQEIAAEPVTAVKPVAGTQAEPAANAKDDTADPVAEPATAAADTKDDVQDDDSDDEKFDLDAALSIETDATNVMEGITPNLDDIAAAAQQDIAAEAAPSLDDLPTLTDSMQVDVEKEVEKANSLEPDVAEAAETASPEKAPAAKDNKDVESTAEAETEASSPAATPEPRVPSLEENITKPEPAAADKKVERIAEAKPAPEPKTAPKPEPKAAAPKANVAAKVKGKSKPEPAPEPKPASSETKPASSETKPASSEPKPAAPVAKVVPVVEDKPKESPKPAAAVAEPVAQVSEMTARIAAIDLTNRASDVDALEAALDAAKRGKLDEMMAPPSLPQVNGAAPVSEDEPAPVPEITLDNQIAEKQAERPAEEQAEKPPEKPRNDLFAAEIGNANSLDEFSDAMAETLFGSEDLDQIAADVVANPPAATNIADDIKVDTEASPVATTDAATEDAEPALAAEELSPEPSAPAAPVAEIGDLRESQQIRADMLQSLNANSEKPQPEKVEVETKPAAAPAPAPNSNGTQPESIEDQISTSMTQTLKALNVTGAAESITDEEDEKPEKKGGLFSRFRKSS